MTYFFRPQDFSPPIEIAPGCRTRVVVGGNRIMFSFVEIDAGAMTPIHNHPEDQMGYVLEGTFERHQGGQVEVLHAGDVFFTPGGVEHGGRAVGGPCRILDVFSPPRATYLAAASAKTKAE